MRPIPNIILLSLVLSLLPIVLLKAQCTQQTICIDQNDGFPELNIGFDRKGWTADLAAISESYQVTLELESPNGCECIAIESIEIEVVFDEIVDDRAAFYGDPGCVGPLFFHVMNCGETDPIACNTDLIINNLDDPFPIPDPITIEDDDADLSFGSFVGIDFIPIVNAFCTNDRDIISQGVYEAEFEVCFTINYRSEDPEEILFLDDIMSCTALTDLEGPDGFIEYEWEQTSGGNLDSNNQVLEDATAGDYNLLVVDENGCIQEDQLELIVIPAFSINADPLDTLTTCSDRLDTFFIETTPRINPRDLDYDWTGPGGISGDTEFIELLNPGTYNIEVTNEDDCVEIVSIEVVSINTTAAQIQEGSTIDICSASPTTLTAFIAPQDTSLYIYDWVFGLDTLFNAGPSLPINRPGMYSLLQTDTIGCATTMANIMVNVAQARTCNDGNTCTTNDMETVSSDGTVCEPCAGVSFDCCVFNANIGDPCDDGDPITANDTLDSNCNCAGTFECPALMLNIGDACDDGNPATMNDTVDANCNCAGEFDCPALILNIGDSCDDGNINTSNDTVDANCNCVGTFECPALSLNIGDRCDDGNPNTRDDTVDANCNCVGEFDCPVLMMNIGDLCDDGDTNTVGDIIDINCNCTGQLNFDCPVLMLNFGAACDDNDPLTGNDVVNSNCECVGTPLFDCPALMLNIGEACDDGDPQTGNDVVDANCNCVGDVIFDCPALGLNVGDQCDDANPDTSNDMVDGNCNCMGTFECPGLMLNIGDACDDGNPLTGNDTVDANCDCVGDELFDCPVLMLDIGDNCDDNDPLTGNDTVDANCDCIGDPLFDCPTLMLDIGDNCDDGDPLTGNDTVDANCNCVGEALFDCPTLMMNIGDNCDDGDPLTGNDTVDANCNCVGEALFDCPTLMMNIGDNCDDGDPNTVGDIVDSTCTCAGQLDFDCPTLMLNIGAACDDGDPLTDNDIVDTNCNCVGEALFDCAALMLNIGDSCDDGDSTTENDIVDGNCDCIGDPAFDCPALLLNIGDDCEDGDPGTENDTVDSNCNCVGTDIDLCSTTTLVNIPCNDSNPCTVNDVVVNGEDGFVCIPCSGTPVDCDSQFTEVRDCDDGNPSSLNDIETILSCDGSICVPCQGTVPNTTIYITNVISLGEINDNNFGIFPSNPIEVVDLSIFDRYGNLVHRITNTLVDSNGLQWDARVNNNFVEQGVYVYRLEYILNSENQVQFGGLTIIR